MSSTAIDENVIKLTLETLGKVIKQVPLTEKLLSRPPFKFIHDIIKEVRLSFCKKKKIDYNQFKLNLIAFDTV